LSRRLIPNLGWLKWLLGAPPPGNGFVVSEELQRLRHEMGRKAILKSLGLNSATIWRWERRPRLSKAFNDILEGRDSTKIEGWDGLHPSTRRQMEKVKEAKSLESCCKRAGISRSGYYVALSQSERCGVKRELGQYLNMQGKYEVKMS